MSKSFYYTLSWDPSEDWDLCWMDTGVTPQFVTKMKSYQKINHFPNMCCISRKNNLGNNLLKMRKEFKVDYGFFPQTWVLPSQWNEMKAELAEKKNRTYIVKPEGLSQGKGIFLTKNLANIQQGEKYVVQRYIKSPYLIDGLKFDLRIYVLVYGCDPLRIYIHKEGLARFATDQYVKPNKSNLSDVFMHLTNYAINKISEKYVVNTESDNYTIGHKRSLPFIWDYIDSNGGDSKSLRRKIKRLIVKTLCAVQPQLSRCQRSCQPFNIKNNMCFEILGFDVLIDQKLKPWLLEVNHTPSFSTDAQFDYKVKNELIEDTVRLLNMDPENRVEYLTNERERIRSRAFEKVSSDKLSKDERRQAKEMAMNQRDYYELNHCGGYSRIYPDKKLDKKYQMYIDYAEMKLEEFYGLRKRDPSFRIESTRQREVPKSAKRGTAANSPRSRINNCRSVRRGYNANKGMKDTPKNIAASTVYSSKYELGNYDKTNTIPFKDKRITEYLNKQQEMIKEKAPKIKNIRAIFSKYKENGYIFLT